MNNDAEAGNLETLAWAQDEDCPYDEGAVSAALRDAGRRWTIPTRKTARALRVLQVL